MRVLQEREFKLWERKTSIEHDSPVIGVYQTHEIFVVCHDSFKTKKTAEKVKQKLIDKYLGWGWSVSVESTADTAVLFLGNLDIIVWIEEKVVSEKSFRVR